MRAVRCAVLLLCCAVLCVHWAGVVGLDEEEQHGPERELAQEQWNALLNRQWHAALHRLSGMVIDEHRVSDLLGPILRHKYELPLVQVRRSLVYGSHSVRMRRVVHDMWLGKRPIKVGAIGGSITHGAVASKRGETDWVSLVGKYLRTAFPRTNITMRNGALPATPSALMNMCLENYVDDDVDLVLVEYVANDGANRFDPTKPKVYERLLRKLLLKKNQPAVVLVQLMPKGMAFSSDHKFKAHFPNTLEDTYGAQAQYYDLPWLSFRNSLWRLAEFHINGHNWTDWMWSKDFMHPEDPGMRVISDMVVNLVQQTALGLLMQPYSGMDKKVLQEPLGPPMHPGNWEALNVMCTYGAAFKQYVDVEGSKGWEFKDEGKPGAPKWGFISTTPGTQLRVTINSTRLTPPKDKDNRMNVMLAYLKSYVKMGTAKVECLSGCKCDPVPKVDALHQSPTSTIFLVRLLVTPSDKCVIGVTLLEETSSGEHKFKVSGIMINEYTGKDVTTQLHEEQWLTQLQQTSSDASDKKKQASAKEALTGEPGTAAAAADKPGASAQQQQQQQEQEDAQPGGQKAEQQQQQRPRHKHKPRKHPAQQAQRERHRRRHLLEQQQQQEQQQHVVGSIDAAEEAAWWLQPLAVAEDL